MVAGRLAERGINPKTGDRLRVAMIEGGKDWTIRDPGVQPGYGYPIRRRMITNFADGIGPEGDIPGPDTVTCNGMKADRRDTTSA